MKDIQVYEGDGIDPEAHIPNWVVRDYSGEHPIIWYAIDPKGTHGSWSADRSCLRPFPTKEQAVRARDHWCQEMAHQVTDFVVELWDKP